MKWAFIWTFIRSALFDSECLIETREKPVDFGFSIDVFASAFETRRDLRYRTIAGQHGIFRQRTWLCYYGKAALAKRS